MPLTRSLGSPGAGALCGAAAAGRQERGYKISSSGKNVQARPVLGHSGPPACCPQPRALLGTEDGAPRRWEGWSPPGAHLARGRTNGKGWCKAETLPRDPAPPGTAHPPPWGIWSAGAGREVREERKERAIKHGDGSPVLCQGPPQLASRCQHAGSHLALLACCFGGGKGQISQLPNSAQIK